LERNLKIASLFKSVIKMDEKYTVQFFKGFKRYRDMFNESLERYGETFKKGLK